MNIYENKKNIIINDLINFIEVTRGYKVKYEEIKEIENKIEDILKSLE